MTVVAANREENEANVGNIGATETALENYDDGHDAQKILAKTILGRQKSRPLRIGFSMIRLLPRYLEVLKHGLGRTDLKGAWLFNG